MDQLGGVLRSRALEELRQFLAARAHDFGDQAQAAELAAMNDAELSTLMHRMTLARPDLAAFHNESRAWLVSHGISGPESPPAPSRTRPSRRRAPPQTPRRRT